MFNRLIYWLSHTTTYKLVMIPLAVGMASLTIGAFIGGAGSVANFIGRLLIVLGFFAFGLMGLPMVIRKEMPWLIHIKGWPAVIEGVALLVCGWVASIGLAWVLFSPK